MLELLADPHAWAALITLTALEVVLGIDNLVFISVLVSRCDPAQARRARAIGLSLALIFRVLLLFTLTMLIALREPIIVILGNAISWRDIILIGGGLFLLAKGTHEIHREIEPPDLTPGAAKTQVFFWVVAQLIAIDLVFSVDSIITAIGMVQDLEIMVAAVVIAMIVMYVASRPVSDFIAKHPTTKMLALAFLLLIGVALIADGFDFHIPRGYIYFAMAFAGLVEFFNVLVQKKRRVHARQK